MYSLELLMMGGKTVLMQLAAFRHKMISLLSKKIPAQLSGEHLLLSVVRVTAVL